MLRIRRPRPRPLARRVARRRRPVDAPAGPTRPVAALVASAALATTSALGLGTWPAGSPPRADAATGAIRWLSGASSDQAANGSYGRWRTTAIEIGGTWNDTYQGQLNQWSICPGGGWASWNKPLDLAIGAIYHERGETWAAAARGTYTARWTAALQKIRSCWGSRDPRLLKIRFAAEMNLPGSWSVRHGEEASFVRAMTLFSDLRYRILPRAQLVFCPNDGTSGGLGGLDVRRLWPGRDSHARPVADIYAVDSYNMYPHVTTVAGFLAKINQSYPNGAPLGIEKHRQLAARLGVPFAISEWSNNGDPHDADGGGESALYIRQFYLWARAHAGNVEAPRPGQLLYEVQFNLWRQYAFWPTTIQPKTASQYRALPWGR